MSAIQSAVSHLSGTSGYKCVDQKGHLDNCKDPHGVCETNAICRFVDDIKRRGKLDKKEVTYSEANNIENGVNNKSSFELVFGLDYDIESGNRVGLQLISPTVYEFDISIYKYNKVLRKIFSAVSDSFSLLILLIVFSIFFPSVLDHIDSSKSYLSGSQIP